MDGELGQADAEQLEQAGLAGVEGLALLADGIAPVAGPVLLADDDLAAHHARRHAEPAQLRLNRVAQGDVVLGGDLAARRHDVAGRNPERAGRDGAGAGKVGKVERGQVRQHGFRVPVGQEQAHGAVHVRRQLLDVVQDGLLGGLAQGAGHEGCLAEEDAGNTKLAWGFSIGSAGETWKVFFVGLELEASRLYVPRVGEFFPHLLDVCVAHVLDADDEDMLVVGDGLPDGLEQLVLALARLLGHLGHVDHSVALRLGHLV